MKNFTLTTLFLVLNVFIVLAQPQDSINGFPVFELGEISVQSTKNHETLTQLSNLKTNSNNAATSLSKMPAITFQNIGGRNEAAVYVRGFDTRGVPVFIDGIPIYVSYDGYVDLGRFKTFDYSLISLSEGLTAMEYGANTLGGAINLVSMQPKSKISVQALLGMASGKSYEYGLNLGSKWNKFFVQASYYNAQNQDLPLSKKYTATAHENGDLRDNSYSADNKLNLKLGFTPNTNNEFTLNYVYQNGEKGTPPYSGTDANIKTRYWQWPHWDKQSLYFISNSKISASTDLKIRVYYDQFYNELKSFDDSTYSSITKPYAFTSIYNDNGYGGNAVLSTTAFANNLLKLSMHYKTDMHREHNIGEPIRHFADNTLSVGIDDNYSFKDKWQLISGFSFNNRTSLLAQEYNAITETLSDFPKNNNSALNAQLAIDYKFNQASNILFYVAERTRFATMKDRYSYRLGKAIPNPDLKAEQALHYNITYKALLFNKLSFDISAYYIKLNNTIQQVDNVQPGIYQMQNTGKALFKGFDFSANYAIVSILNIFGSYSYLERENSSHPEILFTDVPVHKVMAQITLKPIQNLEFSFSEQNNSKRYSTSYGTYAKAFNLLGIDASYKLKQFSFYAGIDNILDENYEYSEGYPAEGRNFFLKILYHFNK